MSDDNKIEASITLDHKGVDVGVSAISSQMTKLDSTVINSASKIDNDLTKSLQNLGGVAKGINFNSLVGQLNKLSGSELFGGLDAQKNALTGIANAGKTALGSLIQTGSGFQTEINKIQSIARFDPGKLTEFSEQLRTAGQQLGLSTTPVEAAAGAYQVLSTGFTDAASAGKVLNAGLQLARAGNAETGDSLKLLAGTLNAYGMSADQAGSVTDKFFQTVNLGVVEVPQLAQSLGLVTSAAAQSGTSLDELLAIISAATTRGVPFTSAVDGMGGVISSLQKPTKEAKTEFAALGIEINAGTLKADGMMKTLLKLGAAVKARGNAGSLVNIFEDRQARNTVSSIFDGGDFKLVQADLAKMRDSLGETKKANDIMAVGAEAAFGRLSGAVSTVATGFEQTIEPVLTKVVDLATGAVKVLDTIPTPIKATALAAVGLTTAVASIGAAGIVAAGGLLAATRQVIAFNLASKSTRPLAALDHLRNPISEQLAPGLAATRTIPLPGSTSNPFGVAGGQIGPAEAGPPSWFSRFMFEKAEYSRGGFGVPGGQIGPAAAPITIASAWNSASAAVSAYTTGVSAAALAAVAIPAVVLGIGAAWLDAELKLKQYNLENSQADRGVSENFGTGVTDGRSGQRISTKLALSTDVKDLADWGFTAKDLDAEAAMNRNKISTLREKAENSTSLADKVKFGQEAKELQDTLADLKAKADALGVEVDKRAAAPAAKLARIENDKKSNEEEYLNKKQDIELSKVSHQEKINQLNELKYRFNDDGNKKRELVRLIANEQKAIDNEVAANAKKAASERLKDQLQHVDNGTGTKESKIAELKVLAKEYEKGGDSRRAIEDRIYKYEEQLHNKRIANLQKLSSLKEQAAQDELARSQGRQGDLAEMSGRGVDTLDAQKAELAKQKKAQQDAIDAQLEKDLANKNNSPEVNAKLREAAKSKKGDIETDFTRQGDQLGRQDAAQKLGNEQALSQSEVRLGGLKIKILEEQLAKGTDVQAQLKQAIEDRLALQEKEIQIQADLAKSRSDDPRVAAQAEREAQGQILEARRAANDEINKGTEAYRNQKAARDQLNGGEFSGRQMGIDEFIKGESDRFAFKKTPANQMNLGIDLKSAEYNVLNQKGMAPRDLSGSRAGATVVNGKFIVEVVTDTGKKLPGKLKAVTLDGRGSDLETDSRAISGHSGLGGY